jgi:CBS domain containing-hemolysin-like protein
MPTINQLRWDLLDRKSNWRLEFRRRTRFSLSFLLVVIVVSAAFCAVGPAAYSAMYAYLWSWGLPNLVAVLKFAVPLLFAVLVLIAVGASLLWE